MREFEHTQAFPYLLKILLHEEVPEWMFKKTKFLSYPILDYAFERGWVRCGVHRGVNSFYAHGFESDLRKLSQAILRNRLDFQDITLDIVEPHEKASVTNERIVEDMKGFRDWVLKRRQYRES